MRSGSVGPGRLGSGSRKAQWDAGSGVGVLEGSRSGRAEEIEQLARCHGRRNKAGAHVLSGLWQGRAHGGMLAKALTQAGLDAATRQRSKVAGLDAVRR